MGKILLIRYKNITGYIPAAYLNTIFQFEKATWICGQQFLFCDGQCLCFLLLLILTVISYITVMTAI